MLSNIRSFFGKCKLILHDTPRIPTHTIHITRNGSGGNDGASFKVHLPQEPKKIVTGRRQYKYRWWGILENGAHVKIECNSVGQFSAYQANREFIAQVHLRKKMQSGKRTPRLLISPIEGDKDASQK